MELSQPSHAVQCFESARVASMSAVYVLRLYITGNTAKSVRAVHNLMKLCDEFMAGRYEIEIIDIYQQPDLAQAEQILAVPMLLKKLPLPVQKFIGDLSNEQQLATRLGLSHAGTLE